MKEERMARRAAKHDWFSVAPGVWGLKDTMVNVYMIHNPVAKDWVLVDAGLKWSAPKIRRMAEKLFWPEVRPSAIVLTHAHFDHVGSLRKLADEWDVPIYAHYLEQPYLTGQCSYPAPDPTVGGGALAAMAWMYPKTPIDVSDRLRLLPEDGGIPGLPGWEYIHTPGHAPGHISLFREWDRLLIAGDAFATTRQESLFSVLFQTRVLTGPPKYFTYDWDDAGESVRKLADLEPGIVATGHGLPMSGPGMKEALRALADRFVELAVPRHGRYVDDPAVVDEQGVTYQPKAHFPARPVLGLVAGAALAAGLVYLARNPRRGRRALDLIRKTGITHQLMSYFGGRKPRLASLFH
jgi:glyoxylase-like metal-dependent hydrolase (beta-lactamase superfamily II)